MTTRISDSEIYINTMDIVEYLKRFNTHNKELDVINEIEQIIQTLDNSLNNNYKSHSIMFLFSNFTIQNTYALSRYDINGGWFHDTVALEKIWIAAHGKHPAFVVLVCWERYQID